MFPNNVYMIVKVHGDPKSFTCGKGNYTKFDVEYVKWKGEKSHFFTCVSWDITAKNLVKLVKSGDTISIVGRLEQNLWTNRKGETINEIFIKVLEFEKLLDNPNRRNQEQLPAPYAQTPDSVIDKILDNKNTKEEEFNKLSSEVKEESFGKISENFEDDIPF